MDVTDYVRSNYFCQVRIYKWWHCVFFFLLDLTTTNMYVMYLDLWKKHGAGDRLLTQLQFLNKMCKSLIQNWHGEDDIGV
jgi:glutathionylspermidine synthase